jgi:beta-lactamase regulating signal transducer with metallopeptidase domain
MLNAIVWLVAAPRLSMLLGLAIRSLIIPVLGAAILALMGRRASASARYLVMLACMIGLLALPVLTWMTPAWSVPILPAGLPSIAPAPAAVKPTATTGQPAEAQPAALGVEAPAQQNSRSVSLLAGRQGIFAPNVTTAQRSASAAQGVAPAAQLTLSPAGWLTLLWLSGGAIYGAWLALGRLRLWRMARHCPVVAEGPLPALIANLAAQSNVEQPIRVRQAATSDGAFITPMTWGWPRPVLLMPGGVLEEWPTDRLRAVLLHELAHIARLDWLTQAITQAACALYWFNPLVWKMATAMEREAEQACDDRVLLAGMQASDYASHLLEVVKSLRMLHGAVLQGGAQTMAAPRSNVQARLISILAADRNRAQATGRAVLAALCLSGLVLMPLAALNPARAAQARQENKQEKRSVVKIDGDPNLRAVEWSWRGDWDKAAQAADMVLNNPKSDESQRANAYWIKFESAWWMDDPAESDRNYQRFAAIAKQHPDDAGMQANLKMADGYRSAPAPQTMSNEQWLKDIQSSFQSQGYADALHATRYLMNRTNVPTKIMVTALVFGYAGARHWNYTDTQALLHDRFQTEIKQLSPDERLSSEQAWEQVTKMVQPKGSGGDINPVSGVNWKAVSLVKPTNLDFRQGISAWKISGESGNGSDYRIGADTHSSTDGAVAFVTARNSNPRGDGALAQTCRADAYRGKRIRYSALVRTEGVEQDADFFLHLDAPDRVRTWNNLTIKGTTDWKRYEYVADVAPNNQGFIFGVVLEGKGKVWLKDVRFEVVDQSVPLSQVGNDFPITDGQAQADTATNQDMAQGMPDQPVNFQFKNGIDGWGNDNPEHTADQDYQIGIDDRASVNGQTAAYLTGKVPNPRSYGTLMQNFSAANYRGKRIRYSAYLKTKDAVNGAGLWIVMLSPNDAHNAGRNMTENPIKGTTEWQKISWVLDVPQQAQILSLGIDLTGKGKVWVRDFQIEVVGNDVPVTP